MRAERGQRGIGARAIVTNTRIVSCVCSLCASHINVSRGARVPSTTMRKRRRHTQEMVEVDIILYRE